jgi:peptidoglycan-associated lipoprotein
MNAYRCWLATFALGIALPTSSCKKLIIVQVPSATATSSEQAQTTPALTSSGPRIDLFEIEPSVIEPGQQAILRWKVSGAKDVIISPAVGPVSTEGTRKISPHATALYTIVAGASKDPAAASALLRVLKTESAKARATDRPMSELEEFSSEVHDIYFDFNRAELRTDALKALDSNARVLKEIMATLNSLRVVIEGHTDELGSAQYNLALGDQRARVVKDLLTSYGLPGDRLRVVSFGDEMPQCAAPSDDCRSRNRRVHFHPEGGR